MSQEERLRKLEEDLRQHREELAKLAQKTMRLRDDVLLAIEVQTIEKRKAWLSGEITDEEYEEWLRESAEIKRELRRNDF